MASGIACWPPETQVKWLADENLRSAIIRGILRKSPSFDIVRVQDVHEVSGQDDLAVLKYATADGRVVVTQDLSTMLPAIRAQLGLASRCAPVVFVPDSLPVGLVIGDQACVPVLRQHRLESLCHLRVSRRQERLRLFSSHAALQQRR